MPRVKTYSAASGFVYQYQFQSHEMSAAGDRFNFETTQDRRILFDITVLLPIDVIGDWELREGRTLTQTERYALAKMALFQAFDDAERPDLLPRPVMLDTADIGAIARALDLLSWDILVNVVMPAAPIPPPFEHLRGRKFSFHPPIRRIESNEWTYRAATWSEIIVRHTATRRDLCIPRRFLGEASHLDRPTVIIGLAEQLEFREGVVWPIRRRVLEMPMAVGENPRPRPDKPHLAPVIGIRLEPRPESRASRLAGGAVALGVLGCLAIVGYSLEGGDAHRRAVVTSLNHTYLSLGSNDTYRSVIQTLGVPDSDRWVTTPRGDRLRLLDYADRGFRAVLIADPDAHAGRYVGSINERGRVLQAVLLPEGDTSSAILHGLRDF